jgi:hypothetical protein
MKKLIGEGELGEGKGHKVEEILERATGEKKKQKGDFFQNALEKLVGKTK